jgi:hypothetical protein
MSKNHLIFTHSLTKSCLAAAMVLSVLSCNSGTSSENETDTTAVSADTMSNTSASAGNASMEANINTLTEQEKVDGWQLIFDGQSTKGWKGYTESAFPEKGWEIKDGTLTVLQSGPNSPAGGDIITEKQYENFDLKFDFKLTPGANSGVLYFVKEVPNEASWHSAPEYQVIDNKAWEDKGELDMKTHRTGDNYDLHAAPADYMKPVGEWNEGRIVVNNGKVEHWLNGQKAIEYDLNSQKWKDEVKKSKFASYKEYGANKKGHIGIQDHGATVYYRNIKIKEL